MVIHLNQILEVDGPLGTRFNRLLHVGINEVALFDVEDRDALPIWISTADLTQGLDAMSVRPVREDHYAPDYSPDEDLTAAAKRVRNRRLEILLPLVSPDADDNIPVLRSETRGQVIGEAVAHYGVAKDKIYKWLRLWWRHGQIDNALLPDFRHCGRGERHPGSAKRGRKLTVGKQDENHVGVNVDARMKTLILRGARKFYNSKSRKGRMTKRQAYQATLETFFHKRLELRDGVLTPIVREGPDDDNRLPTFDQWDYHVEQSLKEKGRLAARYSEREWALKRRPVLGTSEHLSKGPGDLFLIDATIADVYLLSSYDSRWVIGRPVLYLVIDHFSRMIVGLHVALEGPNWTGAMMALANAFTDKVAFCRNYGIEIEYDDWPCDVAPARLTADRGEVISEHADYVVPGFRLTIHDTPPFRADFKSFAEGQFKITNEMGIKRLPGWVDKLRDRGSPDYRYDATLTLNDFIKAMIELALHNNHTRPISSNLPLGFPLESDGGPVPLELWDWGLSNATPSLRRFTATDVRRNLLPTYSSVTSANGLSALGGRLRYTLDRAIDEGWFVRAPTRGGRKHKLAIDPWDVSMAYLRNVDGSLEQCSLIPADVKRFAGRTMADVEDYFDRQRMREKADERKRIQSDADINAKLDGIKNHAASQRRDALELSGQRRPNITSTSAIRNAERDISRLENATSVLEGGIVPSDSLIEPFSVGPDPEVGIDQDGDDYVHMPD